MVPAGRGSVIGSEWESQAVLCDIEVLCGGDGKLVVLEAGVDDCDDMDINGSTPYPEYAFWFTGVG